MTQLLTMTTAQKFPSLQLVALRLHERHALLVGGERVAVVVLCGVDVTCAQNIQPMMLNKSSEVIIEVDKIFKKSRLFFIIFLL